MFKVFRDAQVLTMDPARPRGRSLLTLGDRIAAVFDEPDPDLTLPAGQCEAFDLGGRCVLPAFCDTHLHPLLWGFALGQLSLESARSAREAADSVGKAARSAPPGEAIFGGGWSMNEWQAAGAPLPGKGLLDAAAPGRPVLLDSRCRHLAWANSAALAAANVQRGTPDPEGGEIVRDASGEPTGLLKETAIELVRDALPPPSESARREALARACAEARRLGIASVHAPAIHPAESLDEFGLLLREAREGNLPLRVLYYLPFEALDRIEALRLGPTDPGARVALGGVKLFADGSLGGRTAWMSAPYENEPGNRGIARYAPEEIERAVLRATAMGLGVAVHAIGDAAISATLDAYEKGRAWEAEHRPGRRPATYRIEHLQTVRPEDIARCARLGVWACMQPAHLLGDWEPAERFLGPGRAGWTFAFRDILDAGVRVAFGSDAPIETASVAEGLRAAVLRIGRDGRPEGGWRPGQRVTVEEALRAWTVAGAELAGDPLRSRGLRPGAAADFAIFNRDPTAIPPEELGSLEVAGMVVGGERTPA